MNSRVKMILEHMLEDTKEAILFAEDAGSFEIFSKDIKTRKAVTMSLLNIGELASHLPVEFTSAHPELPWRDMVNMRNLAAHGYHVMNLDVIWDTVEVSLPELQAFLQEQLTNE